MSVAGEWKEHEVIPDVIAHGPHEVAKVTYGSHSVNLGNELTPTQVQHPPTLHWNADPNAHYLVMMVDPDAPSRADPKYRQWLHWIVANVSGNDVSKGNSLADYVGAGPPKDTGLHRYVFLIYKQSKHITGAHLTNRSTDGRGGFNLANWLHQHDSAATLVAGNFFQAQWDDYVPKLYEQLSGK